MLVTGFEPFGGETMNPSQQIAEALHGRVIAGRRLVGAVLPCVFGASAVELKRLLEEQHLLGLGLPIGAVVKVRAAVRPL